MEKIQLTKKQYLGKGYLHRFRNNLTGELVWVECSQEEYERMGRKGGHQFNPTLLGHTWLFSTGETIKVDNPDTVLGNNEYCEMPDKAMVKFNNRFHSTSKDKIVNDKVDEIDLIKL